MSEKRISVIEKPAERYRFASFEKGTVSQKRREKKLVWFFLLTIGFTVCLLNVVQTLLISHDTKKSVEKSYTDDCNQIAVAYSLALAGKISSYVNRMCGYTESDIVKTGNELQIVDWLRMNTASRSPDFDYVLFCGQDGTAYTDTGAQVQILDRSYFKAVMQDGKDIFVDDPVISKTTGKPIIHIARVAKAGGRVIGFFAGIVSLDTIQKLINDIKLGDSGYAWLLAGDGTVIAHQDTSLVMNKNFLTGLEKDHTDITDLAKKMTAGGTGTIWINGFHGGRECIVYAPVQGTAWSFAFAVSESQVYKTADKLVRNMVFTALVILAVLLVVSGEIIFFALKPLHIVENTISGIASGNADLTKRIDVKSDNEIGSVVKGFNLFAGKLQSIITELKGSKNVLAEIGDNLNSGIHDTSAAITQILSNIENVKGHITDQAAGVEETAGAVHEIASNIASLERMIETQAAGVTQASSAVEEMIGNINSVNVSVEKMAESFSVLEKNAADGSSKQQDVNGRIEQIESESEMLQEANTVIASIASQTNLLAMNAAIEAAHAGEAGKGFSVVADEIRKLSETSTTQSKTIGEQLKKIKESINGVVSASAASNAAFSSVTEEIRGIDELVRQIKNAMEEQKEGSRQITAALQAMNDSTSQVKTASSEMSAGNKAILEEVKNLQEATLSIKDSMTEVLTGAHKISDTSTALTDISSKVNESIGNIGRQVDLFKV
jgi:methyl-accepting chemotaxis protein